MVSHGGISFPSFSFPSHQFLLTKQMNLFPLLPFLFFSSQIVPNQTKRNSHVQHLSYELAYDKTIPVKTVLLHHPEKLSNVQVIRYAHASLDLL